MRPALYDKAYYKLIAKEVQVNDCLDYEVVSSAETADILSKESHSAKNISQRRLSL